MDQLLLAGQPCSEAEWNLTQNGLQWKVNNKRKWTYDSGRSINLLSPECQNKREPRRSWVHLGKSFISPKEQAPFWKGEASPEQSKEGKSSKEMLRISWIIHPLFTGEGVTSTFPAQIPPKAEISQPCHSRRSWLNFTTSLHGSGGEPELSIDLIQSRNSTWPRSQLVKDNSQIPAMSPRTQDVLSGQCGLLCLAVARASWRLVRDLAWLLRMLSVLGQHTPRGPAASLLSMRNPAEGSKAVDALRLGLTSSDIGFKPSLLHLHLAHALSSPSSCTSSPPQQPQHWQA